MVPNWLAIIGVAAGIVGAFLSFYVILDSKIGAKKKRLDDIQTKLLEHEGRLVQTERITGVVEEFMEDLLLEQLGTARKPSRKR